MSDLAKYLELPYTLALRRDTEGDFVGRVVELPGCSAHGKTQQEALDNLDEAKSLWIQDSLEHGDPVPLPEEEPALPSGKWLQRVPRKLHRKLQILAKKEGVSFNQFVTALLAEAVGEQRASRAEQILHTYDAAVTSAAGHYYVAQDFEPMPSAWQVVNVTAGQSTVHGMHIIDALTRFASQLPNKSVGKIKEKKYAKEEHKPFNVY